MKTIQKEALNKIADLREQKGKGEETLALIDELLKDNLDSGNHDVVVRLFIEKALVHQHEVMEDRSKDEGDQNKELQGKEISKMEKAVVEAQKYIDKNGLERWLSRVARYQGRVADYKEEYDEAITHYKKAIELVNKDPDNEKLPLVLEYKAFLAYSTMMSGKIDEGLTMSKDLFDEFEASAEGKELKKNYYVWAVWRSGISIMAIEALVKRGEDFDKTEAKGWLGETYELLDDEKVEGDFGFRKDEIDSVRKKISQN